VDFAFLADPVYDEVSWARAMQEPAAEVLAAVAAAYADAPWQAGELRDRLAAVGESFGLKLGKVQAPVRVAVTGRMVGLPLFESLQLLGRAETLRRIASARERVTGLA
jgi:glutamyl-tRNA synthetase